jgi:LacI family transcriptional regulator
LSAKRVTSLDVAKKAGVSRTTVSFVLNNVTAMQISEETRRRVLQAARDLGYVPDAAAQALASGRSKTIGLLLARHPHMIAADMFLTQVLEVLVREVNQHGMRLLLQVVEDFENRESYLKPVRSNSIDGILYSGPRIEDQALLSLVEHGVPTVLMGTLPGSSFYSVDVDNRAAARRATAHLIEQGHTRLACLTNARLSYSAAVDRLQGFKDALDAAGILQDPDLIRFGEFNPESGYFQMKYILDATPPPTAVFVASDVVAFGAMEAIRERGLRIPEDIALVGFDDVPVSRYIEPSLTTMQLPVVELARQSCAMLVSLINGEPPAQPQIFLEANLVVRKSCGAIKSSAHYKETKSFWEIS